MNSTNLHKDLIIKAIIEEAHSVDQKITNLLLSSDRLLSIGMTVSMAVFAGVFRQPKLQPILITLPTIIFILFYYWFGTANEVRSLQAYKKHLEEQLARLLGERYFFWETTIAPLRYKDITRSYLHVIYGIILMCLIGVSIYMCGIHFGERPALTLGFWYILLILGLIHSYKTRESIFARTYSLCKRQLTNQKENKAS